MKEKKTFIPLNLQYFAEPGPTDPPTPPNPTDPPADPPAPPTPPSFTMEDVLKQFKIEDIFANETIAKALQSQRDSAVTNALKTAKAKWEQEKLDELDEAKKLEKMSESQRKEYEFNKKVKAFEEKEKAFERDQLKNATGAELMKRGLDVSFAEYLTADNAENTKARIDAFEQVFNNALSTALNNKMRGTNPPKDPTPNTGFTMDQIRNMTPEQVIANKAAVLEALKQNK